MSPVERARALKDACIAARARDPAAARDAADELARLAACTPGDAEVQALAAWAGGVAELAGGAHAPALAKLEQADAAFGAAGDTRRQAETRVSQIMALALLGRHDEAAALGEQTLACFEEAFGDQLAAGKVALNLASMHMQRDRYAEAAALYRQAAACFAQAGDRTHSVMADVGLATAMAWQLDLDEAERLHERAAQRAQAHGLAALTPLIAASRGRMALHRGRHAEALTHLVAALDAMQAQGRLQTHAETERTLADAYAALHLWPEAQALYARALATAERLHTPIERAWALAHRADVLAAQGASAAAAADLAAARATFATQGNAVGSARVALQEAALALGQGQAATALAQATQAAEAFAAAGVHGWRCEAEVLRAEALLALQRIDEARAHFESTLALAAQQPEVQAACLAGLGRCTPDRGAARARFREAVAHIERQRAALGSDEFRIAYGSGRRSAHDALLRMALEDGDSAALFDAMEAARAQALRRSLTGPAPAAGRLPERERWRWLHAQWQQALAAGAAARAAELQPRLAEAEQAWQEAERRRGAAVSSRTSSTPSSSAASWPMAS